MIKRLRTCLIACLLFALVSVIWVGIGHAADAGVEAQEFRPLNEVKSVNGILNLTLEATEKKMTFGQTSVDVAIYNNDYAAPLLRVSPGDMMNITLVNHLSRPTNLHFHGYQGSPLGHSDNMHIVVNPGESFDYHIKIPLTQAPGLYWYHDHVHGLVEKNIMQGLSGAFIVEGLETQFPFLKAIKEQVFALKDYEIPDNPDPYFHKIIQTINGQMLSQITMHPGEMQLWRFVNESSNQQFNLKFKGHGFRILSLDGVTQTDETDTDEIKISPSSRVEALVKIGQVIDQYALISEGTLTGQGVDKTFDRPLIKVNVAGDRIRSTPVHPSFPTYHDLRKVKIDEKREFVYTQLNDDTHFFINGKQFDHARIDTRVPLGNIEEWTIKNDTDDMHTFHIHQVSFQVVKINDVEQPFTGFFDNVRVPERGSITVRIPFTDPLILGQFMYHCHVLRHEDHGMMQNIEVYDPKNEPPAASPASIPTSTFPTTTPPHIH